jgi:hypothetical protein
MNVNETLIGIFFRLLNFGVLFIGLRHLYLRYITPNAQAEIEADEKKVAIMAQQKDAYYQQEQLVNKEIENQREQITRLSKTLEAWQAAAQDAERIHEQEHEQLELALREKAEVQSAHIAQHMLERRAIPLAIEELEVSLASHFAGDKRGSEYIADVVDHIAKGQ